MTELRGISLWQPWASLIAIGAKRIETRSWSTPYRGLLAIHATKDYPESRLCDSEPFFSVLRPHFGAHKFLGELALTTSHLPRGAIVAVAELIRIVPTEHFVWTDGPLLREFPTPTAQYLAGPQERAFGDFTPGRFGWVLGDVSPLPEPIPCRGAQGLWRVPDDVVARIRAQGVTL